MVFPQYRKYKNNKSYFKITSSDSFEEISSIGSKFFFTNYTAKILPDRNLISDMLVNYGDHWLIIDEEEYNSIIFALNQKLCS